MPFFGGIKEYFHLNQAEQRGLVVLITLLVLMIIANVVAPLFFKPTKIDYAKFKAEIEKFDQLQAAARDSLMQIATIQNKTEASDADHIHPFAFDPNNLPVRDWERLGLSDQQIRVIKNYEAKGGIFTTPDDLSKIYSLSREEFQKLKPYIRIKKKTDMSSPGSNTQLTLIEFNPNTVSKEELLSMGIEERLAANIMNYRKSGGHFKSKDDFSKLYNLSEEEYELLEPYIRIADTSGRQPAITGATENVLVDINRADTLDLQQLLGIGPGFAKRIVKYRELLGGYSAREQLLEVYGIDSLRYAGIASDVTVDTSLIAKIDINQATIKELMRHPYIEFYLAKSIVTHRNTIGRFTNPKELLDAKLVYNELYYKIKPYIMLGNTEM
jgi:competence protein ComEA